MIVLVPQSLPEWARKAEFKAQAYLGICFYSIKEDAKFLEKLRELFPDLKSAQDSQFTSSQYLVERAFRVGVSHPLSQSLAAVLKLKEDDIRVDSLVLLADQPAHGSELVENLRASWREPAIEDVFLTHFGEWKNKNSEKPKLKARKDDSFETAEPSYWDLEFTAAEMRALDAGAKARGRAWNRAEWEVFAQTWSEHCKHKIFAARITTLDTESKITDGLFATHIRRPANAIFEKYPDRCLSAFHDNAGVLSLKAMDGSDTPWAICLKMETHNSPSAISPYGGASTGIVGVHRDILGTGRGAMPIANWDVLCFESPQHEAKRPANALPADIIRSGVIRGIEDGGNQSGIPTVQGSVVFDGAFAVKPLVYAGSVGLLPKTFVDKKPKVGLKMYCFGGAVGADGLRGAVMSSRDIRLEDLSGSAVQVANAFVQRRVTDFLLDARDRDLIDCVTDNGAGGLASSCGEMASLTGGARIDLTNLRLKYAGLHAWERLLSESQERMTIATSKPAELEALAAEWDLEFDRLGELTDSGRFEVLFDGKELVNVELKLLHDGCPKLDLKTEWTAYKESRALQDERPRFAHEVDLRNDFPRMIAHFHLASREGVVRRFDHEVQGRTLRKPFAGSTQSSPQDGSVVEVYESENRAALVLTHGLAPWRRDIVENVIHSFDEALRTAVLCGMQWNTAGLLDNFCWPDPIPGDQKPRAERNLWRLVKANETLSSLCAYFEMPLISGKDSMKNNSRDFDAPATIVISLGASAGPVENVPNSFFTRANEVVYQIPPLAPTFRDSAWERCLNHAAKPTRDEGSHKEISSFALLGLIPLLRERYERVLELVQAGKLRSAKDIGEGGLLMAVFEMCLGRDFGFVFEKPDIEGDELLTEGLGGFVFSVDPHHSAEVEKLLPDAKRLGVVMRPAEIWFGPNRIFSIEKLRQQYLSLTREGFWS